MIDLRSYQRDAVNGIWDYWEHTKGNPLVVAPTGSGKSIMIGTFIRETCEAYPDVKIVMATHVKELIAQNYTALLSVWPGANAGIYSAGLGHRNASQQITYCGIQSIHHKSQILGHVDLLIVDEAHLIPRKSETMYGRFIEKLRETNPKMKVVGFTATPYRLDSGRLDEGEGRVFDGVAYNISIPLLIEEGYLAPLSSKDTKTKLKVAGVKRRGGDFVESELQAAVDIDEVNAGAVEEIIARGKERKSWLIFCAGIDHATHVCEELKARGINADTVSGVLKREDRDRIIADFKAGRIRALTNCNILTTGFDHPELDLIGMMRPTLSTGLYVQMLGRGMRPMPDKENCLVLDFAGNVVRHGPVDLISDAVSQKKATDGEGVPPVKVCPVCAAILYAGIHQCPECGHKFPAAEETELEIKASTAPVMAADIEPEWVKVQKWTFEVHAKHGRTGVKQMTSPSVTMRVSYTTAAYSIFSEWICFEHKGFALRKAQKWWIARGGQLPIPKTIAEGIKRKPELTMPVGLLMKLGAGWPDIVGYKDQDPDEASSAAAEEALAQHIEALEAKTVANGCTPGEAALAAIKLRELQARQGEMAA